MATLSASQIRDIAEHSARLDAQIGYVTDTIEQVRTGMRLSITIDGKVGCVFTADEKVAAQIRDILDGELKAIRDRRTTFAARLDWNGTPPESGVNWTE